MTTLREAREQGKLDQFIAEREAEQAAAAGDPDAFNRALASMAGKSNEAPAASKPRSNDVRTGTQTLCSSGQDASARR